MVTPERHALEPFGAMRGKHSGRATPPEIAVLLSGGIDSMACVHFYRSMDRHLCGIFVDFGQAAAVQEEAASAAVAAHFAIPLTVVTLRGPSEKRVGEISARNAALVCVAAMERPRTVTAIAIGIHGGTTYSDCSPSFLKAASAILRFQNSPVEILAPFLEWHKQDIVAYAATRDLPLGLTYSCEAGTTPPCGTCMSCLDRRELDARA